MSAKYWHGWWMIRAVKWTKMHPMLCWSYKASTDRKEAHSMLNKHSLEIKGFYDWTCNLKYATVNKVIDGQWGTFLSRVYRRYLHRKAKFIKLLYFEWWWLEISGNPKLRSHFELHSRFAEREGAPRERKYMAAYPEWPSPASSAMISMKESVRKPFIRIYYWKRLIHW